MTTTPTARAAAYVAAFDKAESALLDAHAIGGPAREREADEACRYLVSHFIDRLQPADVFPEPESAAPVSKAGPCEDSRIRDSLTVSDEAVERFNEWFCRNFPAGVVVGDPGWWSPRVLRAALDAAFPELTAQVASLVAENERLREDREALKDCVTTWREAHAMADERAEAAEQQLAASEADAARYRFLRDDQEDCCTFDSRLIDLPDDEFDAAIDAAMREVGA